MGDEEGTAPERTAPAVERGLVRFTAQRIEKVRNGHRVTSIARARTKWIKVKNDAASEHPLQETIWACGLAVVSFVFVRSALESHQTSAWVGTGICALLSVLLFRHLGTRITIVVAGGADGSVRVDLEQRLTQAEVDGLNQHLADKLGWPVER